VSALNTTCETSTIETLAALDYQDCKSLFLYDSIFIQISIKNTKMAAFILKEINGTFCEQSSFNSSIIILLISAFISSLFRMTVGNGKVRITIISAFIHRLYLRYGPQFHDGEFFDSASLNKPFNRADFHCLNNVNTATFVKLLLVRMDCKNCRYIFLGETYYINI